MFKKAFLFLLLIVFVFSGCTKNSTQQQSVVKKDNIIVGISLDSKPFGFKNSDGQAQGMEADLAREIADRLLGSKNKVTFKNVSTQDRIKLARSGDVDMVIATITITPQRKRLVNFSEPYFVAGQAICVRKNSKINSLDDLINKRVIVILGTTGEKNIRLLAPNALIQGYSDNTEALNAFKNGSDDAITTDDALLQSFVNENTDYMILPTRLTVEPYGIAFKKSNRHNLLKAAVNKILDEIKYDGTIDRMKDKWGIS